MHILLVDDHTLVREALIPVLNKLAEQVTIIEASDIYDAKHHISRTRNLDLMILDIDLPEVDGLTALPDLRELVPTLPIVVLSGSLSAQDLEKSLNAGAVGFIPKSCSSHEMLAGLRIILQGDVYVPPWLHRKHGKDSIAEETKDNHEEISANESNLQPKLTPRQLETLVLMAGGLHNQTIAFKLNIAEGTVKTHIGDILSALEARNRTEAVTKAIQLGLISIPPEHGK